MNPYFQEHYFKKHSLNKVPDVTLNNVDRCVHTALWYWKQYLLQSFDHDQTNGFISFFSVVLLLQQTVFLYYYNDYYCCIIIVGSFQQR